MTEETTPAEAGDAEPLEPKSIGSPTDVTIADVIEAPDPPAAPEPDPAEEPPAAPAGPKFRIGDYLWINGNSGKYVGEVVKIHSSLSAAEEAFELSFTTVTKVGPLYDPETTHYECLLANKSKATIACCEADAELKWRDGS